MIWQLRGGKGGHGWAMVERCETSPMPMSGPSSVASLDKALVAIERCERSKEGALKKRTNPFSVTMVDS